MARIRTIKPEVCLHEGLYDLERESGLPVRFAWVGLWTQCDREGRFKWRPRSLKSQVLPHDDVDFSRVLDALATRGFVVQYACRGEVFGFIPSWKKHQVINNRECESSLPDPAASDCELMTSTRAPRVDDACPTEMQSCAGERKGKEGKGKGKEGVCDEHASRDSSLSDSIDLESVPVLRFPVAGRGPAEWCLTQAKLEEYDQSFPGVDCLQECRAARQWCIDNPTKKKTASGMPAFLTRWLSRAQNSGAARVSGKIAADPRGNIKTVQNYLAKLGADDGEE